MKGGLIHVHPTSGPHEGDSAWWSTTGTRVRADGQHERQTERFAVRPAGTHDTGAILGLIAASYQRQDGPSKREYWWWKHYQNPFGISPCLVAESNGRLIGVRVFLRWIWQSGSRSVPAVRAVDTATLPEWRGKGIFQRLTMRLVEQMQDEGVSFIYNTPNDNSMPGYLKMGWTSVTRIPLLIRPPHLLQAVRRVLNRSHSEAAVLNAFDEVARVLDDPRLPAFLSDVEHGDDRYHTVRTLPYLKWRFRDIPEISYRARFEMDRDAGALVIARSRMRNSLREVTISELLVTPSTRGVTIARELMSELARTTEADYFAACAARGSVERHALSRAHFLPAFRVGPHFTTRRLDCTGVDPTQWSNWRCSIGDLELM